MRVLLRRHVLVVNVRSRHVAGQIIVTIQTDQHWNKIFTSDDVVEFFTTGTGSLLHFDFLSSLAEKQLSHMNNFLVPEEQS